MRRKDEIYTDNDNNCNKTWLRTNLVVYCCMEELERFAKEQDKETDKTALLKDVDTYRKQLAR